MNGRVLYEKTCAKCHRLFGSGGDIAPELTGSNRTNIDYLLENIIDPSALIPKGFEMTVVVLDDGRLLTGTITRKSPQTITLQTQEDKLVLDRRQIEKMRPSPASLMPESQIKDFSQQQVADLIGYLMGKTQVKLPAGFSKPQASEARADKSE